MKKTIYFIKKITAILKIRMALILVLNIILLISCEKKKQRKILENEYFTQIKKYRDKADDFYFDNKYDSAFYYYKKGLSLCNPDKDYVDYVYFLSSIADFHTLQSNYAESEALLTKTLPYLNKIKEPIYARNVYSYIAYNYYNTYDYNNAIFYHRKALKLPGTPYKKAIVLVNIAIVYIEQKRYHETIDLLEPLAAKKIVYKREPSQSDALYAQILDIIGLCYFNLQKPNALNYFSKSLNLNIKLNDEFSIIHNYKNLALYYEKINHPLAIYFAKKSYLQACKMNSASNKTNSLGLLIKLCSGNELKNYSLDYIKIVDSIIIGRRKAKNQFANIKYIFNNDKTENLYLKTQKAENELELERQKNRNFISYIIIVVILGGITFLYFYLKSKGKREKKQAIFESEIRISNQLRNELTKEVYNTLVFAQNKDLEKENFKEKLLNNLDTLYSKTRNISKENSSIITDNNYSYALKEMISGFKTTELNILLNGLETISFEKIEKNKKIILYRVLQELLINMQKHSYASLAGISFKKTNKNILVNYTDNGNGIDLQNLSSKNGLQNIENRILSIKGAISIDSAPGKGFKVFVKIPI